MKKMCNENVLYSQERFESFHETVMHHKQIYLEASLGWGKSNFIQLYIETMQWQKVLWIYAKDLEESMQSEQCKGYPLIVIRHFEHIAAQGKIALYPAFLKQLSGEQKVIILSAVAVPKEILTAMVFESFAYAGVREIRPSIAETGNHFRKQGIALSEYDLMRINEDCKNMPLYLCFLAVRLKESRMRYSNQVFQKCREDVYHYIDLMHFRTMPLFMQELLLKMSCFERISPALLEKVIEIPTEERDIILSQIINQGNVLRADGEDSYVFLPLMKKFLRRYINVYLDTSVRRQIYRNGIEYYYSIENYKEALRFASILEDEEEVIRCLRELLKNHVSIINFMMVKHCMDILPQYRIEQYPELIMGKAIMESICGNLKQALLLYSYLQNWEAQTENEEERLVCRKSIAYLSFYMGRYNNEHVVKKLLDETFQPQNFNNINSGMPTSSLPSILHGARDICLELQKYLDILFSENAGLPDWFVKYQNGLHKITAGEFCYEKNELDKAVYFLTTGIEEAKQQKNIDCIFVGVSILVRIMVHRNQLDGCDRMFQMLEKLIEEENQELMFDNYKAFRMEMALYQNRKEVAELWMEYDAPNEELQFYTLLRYQYLVKVKIYIMQEQYIYAQRLLQILKKYAVEYGWYYLEIQTDILNSIILYRMQNPLWEEYLQSALRKGEQTGFVRVFADEGAAVYPLVHLLSQKKQKDISSVYLEQICRASKADMFLYPDYLREKKVSQSLSETEEQIVKLLAHGKKNSEIGESLFISENTVKYHLKNIYVKLDASNRGQAVKKAMDYNLI